MRSSLSMPPSACKRRQVGLSLVELMVAMLIGLLVVGATAAMLISNKRIYGSIETMSRIQENARVAFEMMSRDLREAGGNPCAANGLHVNLLTTGDSAWWAEFAQGVRGYTAAEVLPGVDTGTANGQRVAGTDAVEVHAGRATGARIASHATPDAPIGVSSAAGIANGDIMMACNPDYAFVFQVTGVAGAALAHNGGLNCEPSFRDERPAGACPGAIQRTYCLGSASNANCNAGNVSPGEVARPVSTRWYIANNARGGTSLFRDEIVNVTGAAPTAANRQSTVEVVEGVAAMEVTWLESNAVGYVDAGAIGDWSDVVAARIELEMTGVEGGLSGRDIEGTDGEVLSRVMSNVVTLRNREDLL